MFWYLTRTAGRSLSLSADLRVGHAVKICNYKSNYLTLLFRLDFPLLPTSSHNFIGLTLTASLLKLPSILIHFVGWLVFVRRQFYMGPWDPKSVAVLIYLAFNKIEMELNGAAIILSSHYEKYFKWTCEQFGQLEETKRFWLNKTRDEAVMNSFLYF